MTIFEIVFKERQPSKLLNITDLRYRSFARLWAANGTSTPTPAQRSTTYLILTPPTPQAKKCP